MVPYNDLPETCIKTGLRGVTILVLPISHVQNKNKLNKQLGGGAKLPTGKLRCT